MCASFIFFLVEIRFAFCVAKHSLELYRREVLKKWILIAYNIWRWFSVSDTAVLFNTDVWRSNVFHVFSTSLSIAIVQQWFYWSKHLFVALWVVYLWQHLCSSVTVQKKKFLRSNHKFRISIQRIVLLVWREQNNLFSRLIRCAIGGS